MMGLVDYGSSGGESGSESEDEGGPTITLNGVTTGPSKPSGSNIKTLQKVDTKFKTGSKNGSAGATEENRLSLPAPRIEEKFLNTPEKSQEPDFHISDDEEDLLDRPSFLDRSLDEVAPPESDIFSLISKKLPAAKKKLDNLNSLIDKNEDTSDIIKKVDYGGKLEEPPAKKKKSDGPVKISIPSLKQLKDADPDTDELPRPRVTASAKGSGLMALLPDPKNKMTRNRPINVAKPETDDEEPKSARQQELLAREPVKNNLKPSGVRKSGLVPHILSKDFNPATFKPAVVSAAPMTAKASEEAVAEAKQKEDATTGKNFLIASDSDSDSGDEDSGINSGSYFPESSIKSLPGSSGFSAPKSSAPVYGLVRPPVAQVTSQPILPQDTNFISFDDNPEELGPAVSVYPPPAPSQIPSQHSSLIDNEEALSRLAGKAAKRREFEDMQIIDVHEDQMRGDPNVWLQKAMTEEQAPPPDRKAGPKGLAKSKHQITYLAHMAKEKDWELRQEWSQARANKRASMNKYGFC